MRKQQVAGMAKKGPLLKKRRQALEGKTGRTVSKMLTHSGPLIFRAVRE